MIYYIESRQTDPYRNLALEQFVFDKLDRRHSYFMLWQNHNSIIIGKHQNTREEINAAFVQENNITVARRLSGGGAVYHDLGNLNFTFITDAEHKTEGHKTEGHRADANANGLDFSVFCAPIQKALLSLGVPVEISGRNDMTVEGKKFSGNAQYIKQNRVMHHGTILYDSNLEMLSGALRPGSDKIESRGIKSLRSRVTNIRPYLKTGLSTADFWAALHSRMSAALGLEALTLSPAQHAEVEELARNVYSQWSWNYGNSPPYTLRKARRFDGCGKIEVLLDIEKGGRINNLAFYGDFFGTEDPSSLAAALTGRYLKHSELQTALRDLNIAEYFHGIREGDFLALLLE